jgi:hypothetical protein
MSTFPFFKHLPAAQKTKTQRNKVKAKVKFQNDGMAFGHGFYSCILTFAFCTLHFAFIRLRGLVSMRRGFKQERILTVPP